MGNGDVHVLVYLSTTRGGCLLTQCNMTPWIAYRVSMMTVRCVLIITPVLGGEC